MLHSVYRVNDTFIAIMGLLAGGVIIYLTGSVIIPLVIALFITMIINRVDSLIGSALRLRRLRWFTKLTAIVIILGVMFGLVMAAIVSGRNIAAHFPEYEAGFEKALRESQSAQSALAWLGSKGLLPQMQQVPIGDMATNFLSSLVGLLSNFVLVLIFTGFLVASSSAFTGVMAEMDKKVGTYISIKMLTCLLTGLGAFLLCWGFGVRFALFWALVTFLLNFIPHSWKAILFALSLILLNVLVGQVLEPKLMGNRLALKPVAILLGLIFWGLLWGIPGMFLAAPLMILLRILASHFHISRSFERLLATETT